MTAPVPVPLVDLTDEELAAVDGPPVGIVVSPYLEELDAALHDVAVLTAFRSLVARGMVVAPTEEQAASAAREAAHEGHDLAAVEVSMAEEVSQVLTLRRAASTVVCVQRTTATRGHGASDGSVSGTTEPRRTWRYLHVVDGELTLDELVEPTGLHRYGLLRTGDAADLLLDWLAPDGHDGSDGAEVAIEARTAAAGGTDAVLLDRLALAHVLADVTVRRTGDGGPGVLLGTFAGPDGLHLSTTTFGTGADVRLRPVSRRTLRQALADQLEETS